MFDWSLVWPVAAAMVAGGLIGIERTYHGHPAGFRTHILVCLTSCVLMLAAMHQVEWRFIGLPHQNVVIDPTRMTHGLLTGLGFLCAGVIFREGFSVHGLTTAASIWTTSAIGILFGVGMYGLAVIAAAASLAVLAALRLADARLPQIRVVDVVLRWRAEAAPRETEVQALLASVGLKTVRIGHVLDPAQGVHEHQIKAKGPAPLNVEGLIEKLNAAPGLAGFSAVPRDD